MKQHHPYLLLLLLVLVPTAVSANDTGPVLKFFQEALPSALVFTLLFTLPESLILRCRIKSVSFFGTLWRSLLLNIVSCFAFLAVLAVIIAVTRDSFIGGGIIGFLILIFMIILVTKIPMLYVLFRAVPLSWERAISLGVGVNAITFAVFMLLGGWFMAALLGSYFCDRLEDVILWNNPRLLNQASGRIYTRGANHFDRHFSLGVYDVEKRQMTTLTKRNLPSIDLYRWDVEGDTCAFVHDERGDQGYRDLSVVRLSDFKTLLELSADQFSDVQINNGQGGIQEVAVSPDQKKLAIILYPHEGFKFGGKCRLVIVDIDSGKEIAKASLQPDHYYRGRNICWLADSRRVLFPLSDGEPHKRRLYVFDLGTRTSSWFADGYAPSLAAASGNILIQDSVGGFALLNPSGKSLARLDVQELGLPGAVVSPSGNMILVDFSTTNMPGGRLVVFNKENPDVGHVLDSDMFYRVDWTSGVGLLE